MEPPLYDGEVVSVWKGRCGGQEVAAKVFKVPKSDMEQTREVGFPQLVARANKLIVSDIAVLRAGCNMEVPSPSERAAVAGCRYD